MNDSFIDVFIVSAFVGWFSPRLGFVAMFIMTLIMGGLL